MFSRVGRGWTHAPAWGDIAFRLFLASGAISTVGGCGTGTTADHGGAPEAGVESGSASTDGAALGDVTPNGDASFTGAADGATGTAPPAIAGLMIEANPNNNLSCYVSWTTDVPATSEVQFGASSYQFHIVSSDAVTSHRVLVIGMYATTAYMIKAVSSDAGGSASAEGSFMTGALPANLPVPMLTNNDTTASQAGWTMTNIMPASPGATFDGTAPGIVVMYDQTGIPVWYFVNGTTIDVRGDISLRVLSNNDLLLGPTSGEPAKEIDLGGNIVWMGPPAPPASASTMDPTTAPMSHFADKLSNGDYVLFRDLQNADGIGGAYVEEVTPANEVVWNWNLFDHITPPAGAQADWCHPNSVTVDLTNDVFYLSCRFQGVIKVQRSGSQDVLWVLGGSGGGNFTFSPTTASFNDQHDPEIHNDGTVLVYNNRDNNSTPQPGVTSRVVEVSLNETSMTATETFEFPGSFTNVDPWYTTSWFTPYWGDADRLANGNVLVVAGFRSQTLQTHVFEFRPSDGKVVWQIVQPLRVGTYQAERLSPPPLVQPL